MLLTLEFPLAIYGVALLALCMILGLWLGEWLGVALGVKANVGGVGIAMLLLVLCCDLLKKRGRLTPPTQSGIIFWSSIYIPVVVSMAANQNVVSALQGGPAAVLAGTITVALCFCLVPVLSRLGQPPVEPDAETVPDSTTPTQGTEA